MKIYLFRHGETDWNVEERICGRADIPLNNIGLEQAKCNAEILKNKGIEYIYSSPLTRARQTAQALAEDIGVEIELREDLMEVDSGDFDGMTYEECKKAMDEKSWNDVRSTKDGGLDLCFPNGESKLQVRNRFSNEVLNICRNTKYDIIAISAHGFVLKEFIRFCNFEDDGRIVNCEVIEAEFDGQNLKIVRRIKG